MTDGRRIEELRAGLARTEERIRAACADAHRDRAEVSLIVVTKFFPATDVVSLLELGVRDIGENRDQEARAKVRETAELLGGARLPRMHFIGQAQRNKAGSIAQYADVVHSLDRPALAEALDRGAARADRTLDVLIQVDLDPEPDPGRGGSAPADVGRLAQLVEGLERLRLRGVMTVAPLGMDPDRVFGRLAEVSSELRSDHPDARWISAGMSGDLESAVAHGATHLRVGTAILGSRPSHR
ncbi:YggS family pyridoxal phosphate-dependent enzyme [Nostocoides sp. F2B08]|uniref:YggS family pyridoxal phosphate-dependent enzyme n=1 Tax=Nostocoides sp. F2B08 TaxID=2653936 RepID=UPI001D04B9CD|nr:YggS family pyridoxal phosphate-dependent enzyme [Tetrasphaera sp. F2B08]